MGNKKILRKMAIIEKTEELVKESESKDIDMRTVAKELNIAVGTLYNYFPSRQVLLDEVFEHIWSKTINGIEVDIEKDDNCQDSLMKYIDHITHHYANNGKLGKRITAIGLRENIEFESIEKVKLMMSDLIFKIIEEHYVDADRINTLKERTSWFSAIIFVLLGSNEELSEIEKNETIDFFLR